MGHAEKVSKILIPLELSLMWQVSTWQDSCSTLYFSVRFTPRKTHLVLLFDKQPLPLFSPDKVHIINLGARNYSGEIDLSRQGALETWRCWSERNCAWVSVVHTQCSTPLRFPCLFILSREREQKADTKCIRQSTASNVITKVICRRAFN